MLAKEDEGRIGALGIASGFSDMRGLVMDLGGGSMQMSWMITRQRKVTTSAKGAFSFPYGAAALTKRLKDIEEGKNKHDADKDWDEFRKEMARNSSTLTTSSRYRRIWSSTPRTRAVSSCTSPAGSYLIRRRTQL
jgi:exopolyphosphatase/pppGpp-phosphohydrolase